MAKGTDKVEWLGMRSKEKLIHNALMYSTGIPTFKVKWETKMNQCEIDGCGKMIDEKCTADYYDPKSWRLIDNTGCGAFNLKPKETTKMNIQEKDCLRCEKLDEEGYCNGILDYKTKPNNNGTCTDAFTPISGRDCRNCERFNGKDEDCTGNNCTAKHLTEACLNFNPLSTSKPSPTVLTYTDEDGEKVRVTKGGKMLSLNTIWSEGPCGDEYREMSVVFTQIGFNPDTDIPFTEENLNLLSDIAFHWLLGGGFFIEAEEEKVVYEVGQWFKNSAGPRVHYLLCHSGNDVILVCVPGSDIAPSVCSPGRWESIQAANDAIGNTVWQRLIPTDSPIKD